MNHKMFVKKIKIFYDVLQADLSSVGAMGESDISAFLEKVIGHSSGGESLTRISP